MCKLQSLKVVIIPLGSRADAPAMSQRPVGIEGSAPSVMNVPRATWIESIQLHVKGSLKVRKLHAISRMLQRRSGHSSEFDSESHPYPLREREEMRFHRSCNFKRPAPSTYVGELGRGQEVETS